eukprot:TRINITY_DN22132_c0_g1_i1.p1 TRINITY_DN22132_c0_g1~~TRINITY_DN22132_c0_g1_i1.p1  ORF type:complete len:499 (-),score=105.72 TRINITY_DN22132_c0_g1_i1:18-1514(-)
MMEILVSNHWGVPADCVVSIRCGGTRRQAPLDVAAKQVLKFPVGRDALKEPLKIDVLRPVATARLVIHPHEDEYSIGFLDHDDMEIGLNIKPGGVAEKTEDLGKDSQPTSAKSAIGKLEAATTARDYLETHGVLRYVQGLLHALIQLRPEDPFLFMMEQLSARRHPEVRPRPTSRPTSPVPPANSEARDTPRAVPEDTCAQAAEAQSNLAAASARPDSLNLQVSGPASEEAAKASEVQGDILDSTAVPAEMAGPAAVRRTSCAVTAMIYANVSQATPRAPELGDSAATASTSMASPAAALSDEVVASSPAAASGAPSPAAARADPTPASEAFTAVVQEQPAVTLQAESALDDGMEADELQAMPQAESFGDLMTRARESLAGAAEAGKLDGKLAEVFLPPEPQLPEHSPAVEAALQPTRCASDSVLVQASSYDVVGTNVRVLQVELDHLTEESRALHVEVDRLNTEMMTLMETNQALLRQYGLNNTVNGDEFENQTQQK